MATDLERLVVSLEANIKKFEREMARSRQAADKAMHGMERRTQQATRRIEGMMARAGGRINAAVGTMLAGVSLRQIAQLSDSYTKVQNSLKVAGLEGQALKKTYDELFAAAQRHGVPIEAVTALYGRLAMAQKELSATAPQMMQFTEGVAVALKVAGTNATEASGALLQLGQAMGGGKVQAEEYNSILEGARPILQAVAAGMAEAEGSVAKLTALVKDGQVSSEAFFRAFLAGLPVIEKMADSTVPNLDQALTRVGNALKDAAGKMDQAAGATKGFQEVVQFLIDDISKMPAGLQSSIHELERLIQLFGQAKALVQGGLASAGLMDPMNRIEQAFDADAYAVHGSMRGYKPPASQDGAPLTLTVKPIRNSDYAVPDSGGRGGKSSAERVSDLQREIQAIQQRTRALDAERLTIGLSAGDTAKAEAAFRLLEAAKQDNVEITPQLQAQIDQVAAAYGEAAQKIADAEDAHRAFEDAVQEFSDIAQGALSGFISDLREGEDAAKALENMLSRVADRLLDMALNSLFGGSGFNPLSMLLGGGGGLTFNPTGRASGGQVKPGVAYTVGESGRETFVPTTPGRIIPHGKGGGSSQPIVNIYNNGGSQVETRQGPGGSLDVIIDAVEARLASRTAANRGPLYHSLRTPNLRG